MENIPLVMSTLYYGPLPLLLYYILKKGEIFILDAEVCIGPGRLGTHQFYTLGRT